MPLTTLREGFRSFQTPRVVKADSLTAIPLLQAVPTAHQGFLARSQSVPVQLLYARACEQRKRLVLCGEEKFFLEP